MMQKYQKWKKYFTTSDYNKFTSSTLDANITHKKSQLMDVIYIYKMKTLATKQEIKTSTTKPELTTEHDKIVKL